MTKQRRIEASDAAATRLKKSLMSAAKAYGVRRLAEEMGVASSRVYGLLGKKGNPQYKTLLRLIKALNLEMTVTKIKK